LTILAFSMKKKIKSSSLRRKSKTWKKGLEELLLGRMNLKTRLSDSNPPLRPSTIQVSPEVRSNRSWLVLRNTEPLMINIKNSEVNCPLLPDGSEMKETDSDHQVSNSSSRVILTNSLLPKVWISQSLTALPTSLTTRRRSSRFPSKTPGQNT